MSDTVIINSQQVDDLLNKLNDKDQKNKWLYDAVMSGAKVLQQSAQQSFIRKVDGASHNSPYLKGNKPFYEGVSVKGDKAYCEASVSIMNDFRMKFFEKGTDERYTKSRKITGYKSDGKHLKREGEGHYVGKIEATYFFKTARDNSDAAINEAMLQSIDKSIKNAIKQ